MPRESSASSPAFAPAALKRDHDPLPTRRRRVRVMIRYREGEAVAVRERAIVYVHALTHAKERLRHATRRVDRLSDEHQRVSPHYSVNRELAHVAGSLAPRELQACGSGRPKPRS